MPTRITALAIGLGLLDRRPHKRHGASRGKVDKTFGKRGMAGIHIGKSDFNDSYIAGCSTLLDAELNPPAGTAGFCANPPGSSTTYFGAALPQPDGSLIASVGGMQDDPGTDWPDVRHSAYRAGRAPSTSRSDPRALRPPNGALDRHFGG